MESELITKQKSFKGFAEKLKDCKIDPSFWEKERATNSFFSDKTKKERESMKMSHEKLHRQYTNIIEN